ncbi:histone deacetylase [Nocardia sp. NBC_00508]|uniref:histone deacetylase n=1 Tax=Nocardia sp. NBC_00508 TaxID=2975992 RepID=UPI002E81C943|nr:histone deacetylase [Nocardia sp. NBC_00508]WUD65662.1 histone deacetylase [Nocardia sp. NBC_00508]
MTAWHTGIAAHSAAPRANQNADGRTRHRRTDLVWYAAYGSNMSLTRLRTYLRGGCPEGGTLTLPGCRDRSDPIRSVPLLLPGLLYFATESLTWTGGRAFYDPDCPGEMAAHAHLLTAAQFGDIVAQEMYRAPGTELDLAAVIDRGTTTLGPGRYETLVCAGTYDSYPVLTFTAPWRYRDVPGNPPAAAYVRHLAAGLRAAHGWSIRTTAGYLATRPGADRRWTPDSVHALLCAGGL